MFPYNITNDLFTKLTPKESFKAQEGAETAPKVQF